MVSAILSGILYLNGFPAVRNDFRPSFGIHPPGRGDHNLLRILIKPRSPPGERTVGYDVMLAKAHQLHITEALSPFVPVYISYIRITDDCSKLLHAPVNVIGKNGIDFGRGFSFYMGDSLFIIVGSTNSGCIANLQVVPTPYMQCDGVFFVAVLCPTIRSWNRVQKTGM